MNAPIHHRDGTQTDAIAKVGALLTPRNIAIIGASERPNNWSERIHRNLKRYGFAGNLMPINPKRDNIWGGRCYTSFEELPERPDHLLVLSPAQAVPDALVAGATHGARSATIISAGFAELTDAASSALTERLSRVIRETGLAVCGPNCVGLINASHRMMMNIEEREARIAAGPVALISQSGGIAMLIKRLLEERCIDCGIMVSSGSELGLTIGDYIAYCAQDPHIKVILCYVEGLRDVDRFLDGCRKASDAGKPVLVLKTGTSDAGREAAVAHTGALAGSIEAFDAAVKPAGAIRASTPDQLIEFTEYFAHAKLPKGTRVGAMTTSGGKRGIAIDAGSAAGLQYPKLAPATVDKLGTVLGVGSDIGNPLDAGFAANISKDAYMFSVKALLDDPSVDLLVLEGELPRTTGSERREGYFVAVDELAKESDKPIVFSSVASYGFSDHTRALRRRLPHLAFMQGADRSVAALSAGMRFASRRPAVAKAPRQRQKTSPQREQLLALLNQHQGTGTGNVLDEVAAKKLLLLYGVPLPKEALVKTAAEAATSAAAIGFPVVLKVVSSDLPHKSDVGGVVLNVTSAGAAETAFETIMRNVSQLPGKPSVAGMLVAEQFAGALELVIGAHLDPEMGPMVTFGSGGIAIELFRDLALAPCPLDAEGANELIAATKAGVLMNGFRGRPPLDRAAVVATLIALSDMMLDADGRIGSIEINPFAVSETNGACLDALIVRV